MEAAVSALSEASTIAALCALVNQVSILLSARASSLVPRRSVRVNAVAITNIP